MSKKEDTDEFENKLTSSWIFNTSNGHIEQEKVEYGTNMYKITNYKEYVTAGNTVKPRIIETIMRHPDDPNGECVYKTYRNYNTEKGYLTQQINNYHTNNRKVITDYSQFDVFGNAKTKVTSGVQHNLTETMEYDPTGRFVSKYTSPSGLVTEFRYDAWGNLLREENITTALVTEYQYDDMGRLYHTKYPDGRNRMETVEWEDTPQTRYLMHIQSDGSPWVKTLYNLAGREISTQTIGPKNLNIGRNNTYNGKGELTNAENTKGDIVTSVAYTYDDRGRISTETHSNGKSIALNYGNRSLTTTVAVGSDIKVYSKKYDAWSNLMESKDPEQNLVIYKYKSMGKPYNITAPGNVLFKMDYDEAGNQTRLEDPNAGVIIYDYDAWSRIVYQKDATGNEQVTTYDALGRVEAVALTSPTVAAVNTTYEYVTSGNGIHQVKKITSGTTSLSYTYDPMGRVLTETSQIDGVITLPYSFLYDAFGRLQTTVYPDNVTVKNEYDTYGNLVKVLANNLPVWELESLIGSKTTTKLGGGIMTAVSEYDAAGLLSRLKTAKGSTQIRNLGYEFNGATGNLKWRTGIINQKESFYYDALNRLTTVNHGTPETAALNMEYDNKGNIISKTGLGQYSYGKNAGPHALTRVENTGGLVNTRKRTIAYNAFHKAECLKDTLNGDAWHLDILYGPDRQRWGSELKKNDATVKTVIFGRNCEQVIENGISMQLYYIHGAGGIAAIFVRIPGRPDQIYYPQTDHLGSIVSIVTAEGTSVFKAEYDAWGKQTLGADNLVGFHRGYTGHEHLPEFGLINMNGRMYDPIVGRFLSPDLYVQAPDFSQSFNRYSYAINNPLLYIDPSGEFWQYIVSGLVGGVINWATHGADFNAKGLAYFGVGFLSGFAGYGASQFMSNTIKYGGFINGSLSGAAGGFSGGFIGGIGNAWINGADFGYGLKAGLKAGGISGLSGGFIGGVTRGFSDFNKGYTFWNGSKVNEFILSPNAEPSYNYNYDYKELDEKLLKRMNNELGVSPKDYKIDKLTTRPGELYEMTGAGTYVNSMTGADVGGVTIQYSTGRSQMHISPYVVSSDAVTFRVVGGHELVHAYHNSIFGTKVVERYTERVAYKYSYDVYFNAGRFGDASAILQIANEMGFWGGYYPSSYILSSPLKFFW